MLSRELPSKQHTCGHSGLELYVDRLSSIARIRTIICVCCQVGLNSFVREDYDLNCRLFSVPMDRILEASNLIKSIEFDFEISRRRELLRLK